jgi:hypothetical protein
VTEHSHRTTPETDVAPCLSEHQAFNDERLNAFPYVLIPREHVDAQSVDMVAMFNFKQLVLSGFQIQARDTTIMIQQPMKASRFPRST